MRNLLKQTGMVLLAFITCLNFTACSSDEDEVLPEKSKEYTISVGYTGEILDIIDSPLSRATSNDLYGVQVYASPKDKSEFTPYAYGLFDDVANITIKLLEGYKYNFVATMVVNGKNKLIANSKGAYYSPFNLTDLKQTAVGNKFTYSQVEQLDTDVWGSFGEGRSYLSSYSKELFRPNTDRYYGESNNYIPSENGSVNISMKRTSFGAKFIAQDLKEGKLTIKMEEAPDMLIENPNTTVEDIFTFKSCKGAYDKGDTYTENIPVTVNWTKADGVEVPLASKTITFKRNKLTTITVKVVEKSTDSKVGIELETTEMGDGGNETIEGGSGTDTDIDVNK